MRPQQNRRINNNNRRNGGAMRRSSNPLTRNYESTGPDVKIRGNAQHIADKYLALARDANALGDRVMGENYLQHAEHYIRIILSTQTGEHERRPGRSEQAEGHKAEAQSQNQNFHIRGDESDNDETLPQPIIDGVPGEVALMGRNSGYKEGGEEDNNKNDKMRPRRRLPARRGHNGTMRQSARSEGEGSVDISPISEKAANEQHETMTDCVHPVTSNGSSKEEKTEEQSKASRPRRVRRTKAHTETEQAGNL